MKFQWFKRLYKTSCRRTQQTGQMLIYFIVMGVVLVMSHLTIMNIAKLLRDRMMMQNAVDNAAMAAAVHMARTMNAAAYLNLQISRTLGDALPIDGGGLLAQGGIKDGDLIGAGGGTGSPCPTPCGKAVCLMVPLKFQSWQDGGAGDISGVCATLDVYPTGALETCKISHSFCEGIWNEKTIDTFTKLMKLTLEGLITAQEGIASSGPGTAALLAYKVAERSDRNLSGWVGPGKTSIVLSSLGTNLKRNRQEIEWFAAKHTWGTSPSVCPIPPLIPPVPPVHFHFVNAESFDKTDKSWYIYDGDTVEDAQGSVMVTMTRASGDKANKNYPLGANWLGLEWPTIYVTARAAWVNCCGNVGFPVHRSPFDSDTQLWKDPVQTPIDGYVEGEEGRGADFCPADGWNGGRWFAQLIKTGSSLH